MPHKGFKVAEETKKKLSLFNKGKRLSEEHKLKISLSNRGKKASLEVRLKQRLAKLGKKLPPRTAEHRSNAAKVRRGNKSH